MRTPQAIFFDLDGTLLDTARDFAFAINILLKKQNKPPLDFQVFRDHVHGESKKMITYAFGIAESHPEFNELRQAFLETYHQHCTQHTVFFPGVASLLDTLDTKKIIWGIVTNKPTWLTTPIVNHFGLSQRACCIVTGDTLKTLKPDPAPLLYACEKAAVAPQHTIYVGDLETDILTAKAAGTKSIAVTYGYHPPNTNFTTWRADAIVDHPAEMLAISLQTLSDHFIQITG